MTDRDRTQKESERRAAERETVVRLVEAVTLLLGEDRKFDRMREALFAAAAKARLLS